MTTARRRRSNSRAQASGDTDYRSELWRMADERIGAAVRQLPTAAQSV